MSIEMPKSAAAHIKPNQETILTKDNGSFVKVEDYSELDELNNYVDEHKKIAIANKDIKKSEVNFDRNRGKAKRSKPKGKDFILN